MPPAPTAWRVTLGLPEGGPRIPAAAALLAELQRHAQDEGLTAADTEPGTRSLALLLEGSWPGFARTTRAWSGGLLLRLGGLPVQQIEPLFLPAYRACIHAQARSERGVRDNFVDAYGSRCVQAVRSATAKYPGCQTAPPEEDTVCWVWQRMQEKLNDRLLDTYDEKKGSQVGWLFQIMRNLAHDHIRQFCKPGQPVPHAGGPRDPPPEAVAATPGPDEQVGELELQKELRELLQLYRSRRAADWPFFEATWLREEPLEKLCRDFQLSEANAYQRRSRALKELRKVLEEARVRSFPQLSQFLGRWEREEERRVEERERKKAEKKGHKP